MKRVFFTIVMCIVLGAFFTGICRAAEAERRQVTPKKVEADANFDGKVDRTENYDEKGQINKVEVDTNGDGVMDEWIYYKDGKPVKSEKDTNGDGKPDVWVEY